MPDIVGSEIKFIRLNEHDLIGQYLNVGSFEGHVLDAASGLLTNKAPGIVLDIGANMGSFTIPLAYHNPAFHFMAFEPQKMVYYQLCGNLALNLVQNAATYNFGLGKTYAEMMIDVPDYRFETNIGAFSLDEEVRRHDDYLCRTNGNLQQRIIIHTLDSLQISDIRLIKIDVEGMELDVLMGGMETIKQNSYPPIVFEAWQHKAWFAPRRAELYAFLQDLGYEITCEGEDNYAIHKTEVIS